MPTKYETTRRNKTKQKNAKFEDKKQNTTWSYKSKKTKQ